MTISELSEIEGASHNVFFFKRTGKCTKIMVRSTGAIRAIQLKNGAALSNRKVQCSPGRWVTIRSQMSSDKSEKIVRERMSGCTSKVVRYMTGQDMTTTIVTN